MHFEKTSYEAHQFGNGVKKHEDQILLLLWKGAKSWSWLGLKKDNTSMKLLKVVGLCNCGQNYIFSFFLNFLKIKITKSPPVWYNIGRFL